MPPAVAHVADRAQAVARAMDHEIARHVGAGLAVLHSAHRLVATSAASTISIRYRLGQLARSGVESSPSAHATPETTPSPSASGPSTLTTSPSPSSSSTPPGDLVTSPVQHAPTSQIDPVGTAPPPRRPFTLSFMDGDDFVEASCAGLVIQLVEDDLDGRTVEMITAERETIRHLLRQRVHSAYIPRQPVLRHQRPRSRRRAGRD